MAGTSDDRRWTRDTFTITCDPARQDLDVIHGFLSQSYWAKGIPRETVARSLKGSLCFALLHEGTQVGFARVISDGATIALKRPDIFMERHNPNVYADTP